jgi:hypothetical protein
VILPPIPITTARSTALAAALLLCTTAAPILRFSPRISCAAVGQVVNLRPIGNRPAQDSILPKVWSRLRC